MDITGKKIVVVEDDVAMRDILVHKLLQKGFTVKEAPNGAEGEKLISTEHPDMAFMDVMMPEQDGFTTLEHIRASKDASIAQTPIIVLSNLWSHDDREKAKNGKANGYLVKPYYTTEDIANFAVEVISGKNVEY